MLRILVLLLVLLFVALMTWQERYLSTRWQHPLYVSIYPIAADESPVTRTIPVLGRSSVPAFLKVCSAGLVDEVTPGTLLKSSVRE